MYLLETYFGFGLLIGLLLVTALEATSLRSLLEFVHANFPCRFLKISLFRIFVQRGSFLSPVHMREDKIKIILGQALCPCA